MSPDQDASNRILLSTVADVFLIEGRGCVIVPGVPYPSATVPVLRRGAPIVLRRPDGTEIQSSIRELEMINRRPPVPFIPVLLPWPVTKGDVPIGTEVWYHPTPDETYVPEPIA
jgi:hypothetical protein